MSCVFLSSGAKIIALLVLTRLANCHALSYSKAMLLPIAPCGGHPVEGSADALSAGMLPGMGKDLGISAEKGVKT